MLTEISRVVLAAMRRAHIDVDTLSLNAAVDVKVLRALERGDAGISTDELDRLAEALDLDAVALLEGRDAPLVRPAVFLRHQGSQDFDFRVEGTLDSVLTSARSLLTLNQQLEHEPGLRRSPAFHLCEPPHDSAKRAAHDGYRLARRFRQALGNISAPMPDLGILLEEQCEILIEVVDLGTTKLSALALRDDSGAAAIVLNQADSQRAANPQLARVHLPHELCHLLHDPSDGGLHIVLENVDESAAPQHERAEQRARAFAAELLLPRHGLIDLLGKPTSADDERRGREMVAEARRHFTTPWEIATHHLFNLGFISAHVHERLRADGPLNAPYGAATTRLPLKGEGSITLRRRVREAHERGVITDGQARVALRLGANELLPGVADLVGVAA